NLTATLDDYAHPRIQAQYQATVDAGDLRKIMNNSSLPIGVVNVAGSMHYMDSVESLRLDGNITSNALLIQIPDNRLSAYNISAHYLLDKGDVRVENLRANVLGGGLTGNLTVLDVQGAQTAHLQAALKNVGL